jgi:hypothetical protein
MILRFLMRGRILGSTPAAGFVASMTTLMANERNSERFRLEALNEISLKSSGLLE